MTEVGRQPPGFPLEEGRCDMKGNRSNAQDNREMGASTTTDEVGNSPKQAQAGFERANPPRPGALLFVLERDFLARLTSLTDFSAVLKKCGAQQNHQ